jgi:LysM repeat protein
MLDASNSNTQLLASNSKKHKVYKINNGDTFWGLARRHNTRVTKLLTANGLSKNTTLRIGSSIKIPQS